MSDRVETRRAGRTLLLRAVQRVPAPIERVFPFFADPRNLERITPPFLNFHVRRVSTPEIRMDTRLLYTLRLHGVPVFWRTRIEAWEPPHRFVDRQLAGPYALWHHLHEFRGDEHGTELRDTVHYRLFCAPLARGPLVAWVHRDVRSIFEFRQTVIRQLFAPGPGGGAA